MTDNSLTDNGSSAPDFEALRSQFPILSREVNGKPLVYLDSAASAQKPNMVLDAVQSAYEDTYSNVHRGLHFLSEASTDAYEAVRKKVAEWLGASSEDEIIFTSGATMSLNLIAHCHGPLVVGEGDEILISVAEHHANIVPWQMLAQRVGARVVAAPVERDGSFNLEVFKTYITTKTKLISLPHVSNVLGTVFPITEISKLARDAGATFVVDGCQGCIHMPVDMSALGCDFYVFSAHKLYGPSGIGVLWGRSSLLAEMPPFLGGGDMIDVVEIERSTYADPPHRFEAGTPPITEVIGLGAAIDFVQSVGMVHIHEHETNLIAYGHDRLRGVKGLNIFGDAEEKSGVISFTLDSAHPHDISTLIDQDGVAIRAGHHCAQPLMAFYDLSSTARASVGLYTKAEDFDILATSLEKVNRIFG